MCGRIVQAQRSTVDIDPSAGLCLVPVSAGRAVDDRRMARIRSEPANSPPGRRMPYRREQCVIEVWNQHAHDITNTVRLA
jgi:hypothetical protein